MRFSAKNQAFSLLELVLVLTLLGLAASIVAPTLSRFSKGRETADASAQMLTLMQYAQDQAMTKGTPMRLQFDLQKQNYSLAVKKESKFTQLSNEFGRTHLLAGKIQMIEVSPSAIAQQGYIQFDPDGGHDVAVIRLTGTDSRFILIGTTAPAEPFRIATNVQP